MRTLYLTVLATLLPVITFAAVTDAAGVVRVIENIGNWLYTIFLVIAVIMVILAAYKYLLARGGDGVHDAHKMLLYTAIAVGVAVLAKGFVRVVETIVN